MNKVYVLQIPNRRDKETGAFVPVFNVAPASEFGEIKIMMPPEASFYATRDLIAQLRAGFSDFDPDKDSVVVAGDPAIIGTACALLGRTHGRFRLLKWDRKASRYIPVEVSL